MPLRKATACNADGIAHAGGGSRSRCRAARNALYAWLHRDYATAPRLWRELAEQGDAKAQIKLGLMYQLGQGVPQENHRCRSDKRR
jgi:TPR repeat protein